MRITLPVLLVGVCLLTACVTTINGGVPKKKVQTPEAETPETVMVYYYVKPDMEAVMQDLFAKTWALYRKEGLVYASPHIITYSRDADGKEPVHRTIHLGQSRRTRQGFPHPTNSGTRRNPSANPAMATVALSVAKSPSSSPRAAKVDSFPPLSLGWKTKLRPGFVFTIEALMIVGDGNPAGPRAVLWGAHPPRVLFVAPSRRTSGQTRN